MGIGIGLTAYAIAFALMYVLARLMIINSNECDRFNGEKS